MAFISVNVFTQKKRAHFAENLCTFFAQFVHILPGKCVQNNYRLNLYGILASTET